MAKRGTIWRWCDVSGEGNMKKEKSVGVIRIFFMITTTDFDPLYDVTQSFLGMSDFSRVFCWATLLSSLKSRIPLVSPLARIRDAPQPLHSSLGLAIWSLNEQLAGEKLLLRSSISLSLNIKKTKWNVKMENLIKSSFLWKTKISCKHRTTWREEWAMKMRVNLPTIKWTFLYFHIQCFAFSTQQ